MSTSGKIWLAVILALAAAIRLLASYLQPAYVDEAFNQFVCATGPKGILDILRPDTHTPFLHLVMYPLTLLTDSIFVLRCPSIIFGILTIVLNYYIFRKFYDECIALWLTAFTALSYQLFMNDALFRPYSFLTFFMSMLWLAMLDVKDNKIPFEILGEHNYKLRWLLFSLICLICGSLHYVGTMVIFVCCVWAIIIKTTVNKKIIAVSGLIGCLPSLLWLIWTRMIPNPAVLNGVSVLSAQNIHNFVYNIAISYFSIPLYLLGWNLSDFINLGRGAAWGETFSLAATLISIVVNAFLWYYFFRGYMRLRRENCLGADLMAISLLFSPVMLSIAGFFFFVYWGHPRYVVPMTLPFIVLLFSGLGPKMQSFMKTAIVSGSAVLCLFFPFAPEMWNAYWQGVIDAINLIAEPNDIIIVHHPYSVYAFAKAYNPEGIDYKFEPGRGLVCQQHRVAGKLPVVALESWMLNDEFVKKIFIGHRLLFVVSQPHQQYLPDCLAKYYYPYLVYQHNCLIGWGIVDLVILEEKQ